MHSIGFDGTSEGWLRAARSALYANRTPEEIVWSDATSRDEGSLWGDVGVAEDPPASAPLAEPRFRVPKRFLGLTQEVGCHSDPRRWDLLYRLLWRITHGEPHLLEVSIDPDTRAAQEMEKAVGRDVHKMRAFVRFREVTTEAGPWFVAWFEPAHHIVERNAPFFRDRFASLRWSILTPERCAHWDGGTLTFSDGVDRSQAPTEDAVEELWRAYYGSVFNPARVKEQAMRAQMPAKYWKNLPEAPLIPQLLHEASRRVEAMHALARVKRPTDAFVPFPVPETSELSVLASAVQDCRGCPLWKDATCAVFGEGPTNARVVVVGEQPGDQEDRVGKPFVGPAGQLFNRALAAAGVDRAELYVTNAVKHFKWTPRGKRRLHAKPNSREVAACRPWLEAELRRVQPELILCLGATAAQSVLGQSIRVTERRGQRLPTEFGAPALVTLHPSALLRLPPGIDPAMEFDRFVADLKKIKEPV